MQLVHALGARQQQRHGAKRLAAEVLVQPGCDHTQATVRQVVADVGNRRVKELHLVDGDHFRIHLQPAQDILGAAHDNRILAGDTVV